MNTITQESLELMNGALAQPDYTIAKSISTQTGLLAYDLQAPAKNLYPFVTPLRNIIPRVGGGVGSATNWRQITRLSAPASMRWGGSRRPAFRPDVVFDLNQDLDFRNHWRGRRGNLRSHFRRPHLRGRPGDNGVSPLAENDAQGGDGDSCRQCLFESGYAINPDVVGIRHGRHAPGCDLFRKSRGADA